MVLGFILGLSAWSLEIALSLYPLHSMMDSEFTLIESRRFGKSDHKQRMYTGLEDVAPTYELVDTT